MLKAYPFNFDNQDELVKSLKDVKVLYNTYWVRFNHKGFNHNEAVDNTIKLFNAALKAGVESVVHVSITNPDKNSNLEYFKGKGILEEYLMNTGLSYSILRPTVIFGKEDILINNMAWMVYNLSIIGIFGDGKYSLQPIYVMDLAEIAVEQGGLTENKIIDAIGPETFQYRELFEKIMEVVGKKKKIISVSDGFGYFAAKMIGWLQGDVVITKPEIEGLKSNLLLTNSAPAGHTKLTEWMQENKDILGKVYSNELKRRSNRMVDYLRMKKLS
jgi:NADH dehydrogenase